jgi:cysteinyl-tRNA synthetase
MLDMRNQARADKNFALSDQIRDQLIVLGIQLKVVKKEHFLRSKAVIDKQC